jgi:taurine dioxygenase
MTLDIKFSGAPLGHEIRGVDLRTADDETFHEIEKTFDTYGVVVIRDQKLDPEQQVAYSRRFGPLDRFVLERFNHRDFPEVFILSNIVEDGRAVGMDDAGRYWHSDMWVSDRPPRGSVLHALEVPHRDSEPVGDTCFASTAYAYDTLDEATKQRIKNLSAVFSSAKYADYVGHSKPKDLKTKEIMEAREKIKDREITHRLVRTHPRTGRKCLYVVEGVIARIVGMDESESEALVQKLLQHIVRPEVVYRHRWRVGDVVMWDNYSAVHRAVGDFELPQRRLMHRTTLSSATAPAA